MSTEFHRNTSGERSGEDNTDAKRETATDTDRLSSQPPAETATERSDTSYLPEQASGPAHERWQHIQAAFVDDPRKAVTEAHQLVGELTQRIVDAFAHERDELEQQWSRGGDVSTEDLRVSLQRYRAFFSRLLPSTEQFAADKPAAE
jgi:hypothetical protein